ncbi:methyltransferase family protein [Methylocaldum szegediense]|uniref:Protein-S-isoprenylcysteine O-methyltransferase Ste14 n=1 Tax=Methylocaldum szegediense TaxID=73780 RepID=A0ABN8XAI6_9GAMM|nr:isoprenylcysteine carboxylmethyltransferase family protein [Methylocaldum szegediense]CAI8932768.1 Protein-S-isoprenylcysteine O-methyltransferase Ste14 [Methylocaldum szegediense]
MQQILRFPPPVIALALAGLGYGLAQITTGFPSIHMPSLGIILMAVGATTSASALFQFRLLRTTFVPTDDPTALAKDGPYCWTRNPMYLGILTALMGLALFVGSLSMFIAPIGFFFVIDRHFIPYEENKLISLFAESYQEYQRRVPRWL